MRIFWGLVAFAAGITLVMKTEWFLNNFGRLDFFESKLSTFGGSRMGYKLLGLGLAFFGLALVLNLTESLGLWIASFFMPMEN